MTFTPTDLFRLVLAGCALLSSAMPLFAEKSPAYLEENARVMRLLWDELQAAYPAVIDPQGGYHQDLDEAWQVLPSDQRSLVNQARHVWTTAEVALRCPELHDTYLDYTRHGIAFLRDTMWDAEQGGFYWGVDRTETGWAPENPEDKHVYGMFFAVYACAHAYRAGAGPEALELAERGRDWIERHAHDAELGGYFGSLNRAGQPVTQAVPYLSRGRDQIGTPLGAKSMNTTLHALEAYTELLQAEDRPDKLVEARVRELVALLLGPIYAEPGTQHLFLTRAWEPIKGEHSFGHDVEAGFLLLEAAEVLGDEALIAEVRQRLRAFVEVTLEHGYDHQRGGVHETGTHDLEHIADARKSWWPQAEVLNGLLMMHELSDDWDDRARYWATFGQLLDFVATYSVDEAHGGWWNTVDPAGNPVGPRQKTHAWKATYHTVRALFNCAERLQRLAGVPEDEIELCPPRR